MKKDTLARLLLRYEHTLRYFPAEAIGRIRRYQEHLKRKQVVEKLIGKKTASSLTWLHDTERPFYRYGDWSDEIGLFGVAITLIHIHNNTGFQRMRKMTCMIHLKSAY